MKKKKRVKVKFKLKNGLIALLVISLITLFGYLFLNKQIDSIYVINNNLLREQEVIDLSALPYNAKYYQVSPSKIVSRLKASPFIEDAKVSKNLFSVTIDITEYKALWYLEYDDSIMLSSGTSVYVEQKILGLPILTNQVLEEYTNEFIEKMQLVEPEVLSKISEITYDPNELDNERFLLYMNDTNYVYLTLSKFEYINNYNELLPKLEGKKGILYLDSGNHFEIKK